MGVGVVFCRRRDFSAEETIVGEKTLEFPVVVFANGNQHSKEVIKLLQDLKSDYHEFSPTELRQGKNVFKCLAEITDVKTPPWIFIGGKFVGGLDSLRQLEEHGELDVLLKDCGAKPTETEHMI